jgi:hypothetical protein
MNVCPHNTRQESRTRRACLLLGLGSAAQCMQYHHEPRAPPMFLHLALYPKVCFPAFSKVRIDIQNGSRFMTSKWLIKKSDWNFHSQKLDTMIAKATAVLALAGSAAAFAPTVRSPPILCASHYATCVSAGGFCKCTVEPPYAVLWSWPGNKREYLMHNHGVLCITRLLLAYRCRIAAMCMCECVFCITCTFFVSPHPMKAWQAMWGPELDWLLMDGWHDASKHIRGNFTQQWTRIAILCTAHSKCFEYMF